MGVFMSVFLPLYSRSLVRSLHDRTMTTRPSNTTGVVRDATSYTGAIVACSRNADGDKALEWLKTMSEEGIAPEVLFRDSSTPHTFKKWPIQRPTIEILDD